jgi:uncharacterized protein YjbI with pentapeptide repeats
MDQNNLNEILTKHVAWLRQEKDGERADLYGADLHGVNLHGVNLHGVNMVY